ncbi:hypothetical protein QO004_005397 [Rhizobium mesoamericanum]|uniref:hypothetical protein n=1 Tax=Rhizobium mesoamericanum TaxID=1079800 RepID=UPI00277FDBFA|nr:hypothetical protein [Rhizobium mesoamericanum]MDQ0563582.1 hypothetical protein [Rhizobium mesoamericanum]
MPGAFHFNTMRRGPLSPPADAMHVHNATVASPYGNLEPVIASPRAVNKEAATAVYSPDIPEAPVAQ